VLGQVTWDFSGETWTRQRVAEYAVSVIAGPLGEKGGAPQWPLRTDDGMADDHSDEKALARLVDQLGFNQKQYEGLVHIAQMIVGSPYVKRAIDDIATLLSVDMTLDERMLADLYDNAIKSVQRETAPPTTEELEHAAQVEQHRQSMTAYLAACDQYRKEEDAKALRRECDRITREFELD
jgi:hypothetical protein